MVLEFAVSQRSTVGLEWELALVDADSGDMRQAGPAVVQALSSDDGGGHPNVHPEFLRNTVEIVSGVAQNVAVAGADLVDTLEAVRTVTDPMRVELVSAGTHPFSHWGTQKVTDKERYHTVVDRAQMWGRQMLIYGVHVHVGIEDRAKVLPIIRSLLVYYPHLLALSASSPFFDGRDTGYASMRALLFQQLPTAGLPYQFETWDQLEAYVDDMLHTGVIDGFNDVRWDVRPSPRFGTIEVRVSDGTSNIDELLALAALTHCLVEHLSTLIDEGKPLPTMPQWFVQENKWRAARYGMDAIIILDDAGNEELVTDATRQLVAELEPVAARLGCAAELAGVLGILDHGASYQRQLAVARAHGGGQDGLEAVVAHLVAELRAGHPLPTD
ncbi:glutamate--cysteine ligase GCS2 [Xylanimonas cellulosilytica DSM 15894]|uniref:Putative glutamate--cysteine ligase 2 n=1 Tax=Xylanimonas cellulosilytica (strain DSM 15894 / JCM 12276 / CECT 5975 / KCTC 9989 / LMG 20990 / NBRC 107835 / XIL07) TaxID=446471 RepID=D1BXB0_XYLCX|nr:glutamate--cysteine ligase [Xylanimonas cellulosilytica]ACZ29720.1 glutamate--cysteine ligase GCS2 [Xylanimonas cellulosilytica DSM 15894]